MPSSMATWRECLRGSAPFAATFGNRGGAGNHCKQRRANSLSQNRRETGIRAMMELGATICTPSRRPQCLVCPVAKFCRARASSGDPESFPEKKQKKKNASPVEIVLAAAVFSHFRADKRCSCLRPEQKSESKPAADDVANTRLTPCGIFSYRRDSRAPGGGAAHVFSMEFSARPKMAQFTSNPSPKFRHSVTYRKPRGSSLSRGHLQDAHASLAQRASGLRNFSRAGRLEPHAQKSRVPAAFSHPRRERPKREQTPPSISKRYRFALRSPRRAALVLV